VTGGELQPRGAPERLREPVGDHGGRESGIACGQSLAEDEDVGPGGEELGREEVPDAAERGDDLVEDEHDVVTVAEGP
jgi:hypothetical protein